MNIKYCDRCGMQMENFIAHMTYAGNNEVELCEECFDKLERWLACENIEDRLERIADRLEKMVNDTDGISNKS